jgi:hypothetical protein
LNTEVRVQGVKTDNSNPVKLLLGLLDTGATGIFVKQNALENFDHKITKTKIQVKGRYAQSTFKEIAHFAIKLPDFCNSRTVDVQAYVEDFQCRIISWDDISIPMRQKGTISTEELCIIEDETPNVLKKAINRVERSITSNSYQDHDYQPMVLNCTHLSKEEQDVLLKLFSQYASLFDGTLGKIPNVKVHLELKANAKPYCARAYKISHHIMDVAEQEVEELCKLGVLQKDVYSEWGAPCLFHAKKMEEFDFLQICVN